MSNFQVQLNNDEIIQLLTEYFAERRTTVGGVQAQFLSFPAFHRGVTLNVPVLKVWEGKSLKWEESENSEEYQNPTDHPFIKLLEKKLRQFDPKGAMKDSVNYALHDFSAEGEAANLTLGTTKYFSLLIGQDFLEHEFFSDLRSLAKSKPLNSDSKRQLFDRLDARLYGRGNSPTGDLLLKNSARKFRGLAVSTLVVYPDDKGLYLATYRKRSKNVAVHPELFHVIPAGMYQYSPDPMSTAKRELIEEMFAIRNSKATEETQNLINHDIRMAVELALEQQECILTVTGLVVNALNLRPEICALLFFKNGHFFKQYGARMHHNWEYEHSIRKSDRFTLPLDSFAEKFVERHGVRSDAWIGPGLAALLLGVKRAKELALQS